MLFLLFIRVEYHTLKRRLDVSYSETGLMPGATHLPDWPAPGGPRAAEIPAFQPPRFTIHHREHVHLAIGLAHLTVLKR